MRVDELIKLIRNSKANRFSYSINGISFLVHTLRGVLE